MWLSVFEFIVDDMSNLWLLVGETFAVNRSV